MVPPSPTGDFGPLDRFWYTAPMSVHALTDDLRVDSLHALIPPAILIEEIPLTDAAQHVVAKARKAVHDILHGIDHRLLVICGPCSIHDPAAALDYAHRLKALSAKLADRLFIVMRCYFEKPRTTVGWKGLINDPGIDDSFQINKGLRIARGLLRDLTQLEIPIGTEFLDPITPQYVADLISWSAVGARTTESQIHREMASGLSMAVGFKNATSGAVQVAIDAVGSSRHRHHFLGVTKQGLSAIIATKGNPDAHIILRGGSKEPNYDARSVSDAAGALTKAGLLPRLMIDCSHANSHKDYRQQPVVAAAVADQIRSGSGEIFGVMLESFLVDGAQKVGGKTPLNYGQSITDACMGWEMTEQVLQHLAQAVSSRPA